MGYKHSGNKSVWDKVIKQPRRTQNFASICEEIAKDGKTYAEWQNERYGALYDVKTGIKEKIRKLRG